MREILETVDAFLDRAEDLLLEHLPGCALGTEDNVCSNLPKIFSKTCLNCRILVQMATLRETLSEFLEEMKQR